ncbi:MAG: porin family protein [Gammaproteobacteria bacterium]|nr:porin family protein [Gammaproteobacteria bacterium]
MKATGNIRHPSILTLATVALLAAPAVQADTDAGWYLAPALNYIIADGDRDADDDAGFQIGLGRQLDEAWNLEGVLELDTLDSEDGADEFKQRGLALDGLYFFDRNPGFAPYALVGAGVMNTRFAGEKGTNPMLNAGIGFLSNVLGDAVALRGEARYRYDGDDSSASPTTFVRRLDHHPRPEYPAGRLRHPGACRGADRGLCTRRGCRSRTHGQRQRRRPRRQRCLPGFPGRRQGRCARL